MERYTPREAVSGDMGKLTPAELDRYVLSRGGASDEDLLVGPAYGEDAAALGVDEGVLVVSADPVSLAAERIGQIGVAVASNDVAASGGIPEWLVSTVLLPERDVELLDTITAQLHAEAERLGIAIVGGHTESVAALSRPLLSLTCLGPAERFVATGGAEPGDRLLLTKGAGIEGTAVLATDFREELRAAGVEDDRLDRAAGFFDELSVIPEARALTPLASAMHDPTEGGVLAGAVELARTSETSIELDPEAVPVRPETRRLCGAMAVDPLRILGSGALLAAVPETRVEAATEALAAEGIDAAAVGRIAEPGRDGPTEAPGVSVGGDSYAGQVEDEVWALWE